MLLAGGGSGHEPAYAGYIGDGMLDIAVAGQIFASPSATQVEAGLKAVNSSKGYTRSHVAPVLLSAFATPY